MFLCVFFMILSLQVFHCQYLGNTCHNEVKNATGTCKILKDCQSAISDLKKGIIPQNCGFEGSLPVVCCVDNAPSSTTTTNKPTEPTPKPAAGIRSLQKCIELGFVNVLSNKKCTFHKNINVIVGGIPADPKEFPHMALIGFDQGNEKIWNCGGSLISENYVLTAAHCLFSRAHGKPTMVRLGDVNLTDPNDDGNVQEIGIKEQIVHPKYHWPSKYNDIALLLLESAAKLGMFVRPACLYTKNEFNTQSAIATGWGFTEFGGEKSDWLMKVVLQIFTASRCNITYAGDPIQLSRGIDNATQFCAGSDKKEKDTCQGDSGGPMQIYSGTYCMYDIIGVTSFGKGCGNIGIPGVFTRIYPYLQWIEDIVWPSLN